MGDSITAHLSVKNNFRDSCLHEVSASSHETGWLCKQFHPSLQQLPRKDVAWNAKARGLKDLQHFQSFHGREELESNPKAVLVSPESGRYCSKAQCKTSPPAPILKKANSTHASLFTSTELDVQRVWLGQRTRWARYLPLPISPGFFSTWSKSWSHQDVPFKSWQQLWSFGTSWLTCVSH